VQPEGQSRVGTRHALIGPTTGYRHGPEDRHAAEYTLVRPSGSTFSIQAGGRGSMPGEIFSAFRPGPLVRTCPHPSRKRPLPAINAFEGDLSISQ
jgi:hypothetical protein